MPKKEDIDQLLHFIRLPRFLPLTCILIPVVPTYVTSRMKLIIGSISPFFSEAESVQGGSFYGDAQAGGAQPRQQHRRTNHGKLPGRGQQHRRRRRQRPTTAAAKPKVPPPPAAAAAAASHAREDAAAGVRAGGLRGIGGGTQQDHGGGSGREGEEGGKGLFYSKVGSGTVCLLLWQSFNISGLETKLIFGHQNNLYCGRVFDYLLYIAEFIIWEFNCTTTRLGQCCHLLLAVFNALFVLST